MGRGRIGSLWAAAALLAAGALAAGRGAVAQDAACDPACGGAISPICLETLGAGSAALPQGAPSADACGAQLRHYRDCLTQAAEACGVPPGPAPADGGDPRELLFFQRAEEQRSAELIEAFLEAYPASTLRPLAERYLRDWRSFTPDRHAYRQAQTQLKKLGYYSGPVDGNWRIGSQAAMRAFQRAEGVSPADGTLREASLQRLAEGAPAQAGGADPAALADLSSFRDCPTCPEMVLLPAGAFTMGSPESEPERRSSEGPQRRVDVARFAIAKTEASRADWLICYEAGACDALPSGYLEKEGPESLPANSLSRVQIAQYLAWLSEETGLRYRLPSEAEWEYAARAGTETAYPTGETISPKQANLYAIGAINDLGLIASHPPNRWGLFDMIGNVAEWTADCWRENYEGAPTDGRAWGAAPGGACKKAPVRGGGFEHGRQDGRSAARRGITVTTDGLHTLGFRVARDVDAR